MENIKYNIELHYDYDSDYRSYLIFRNGTEVGKFDDFDDAKEFVDEWIEIDEYNKKINK